MADDKKNIPDAGKVDEPPKPGKVEPVKADPPVQDQPAQAKAESPVLEDASKVVASPTAEQLAPAGKEAPKDILRIALIAVGGVGSHEFSVFSTGSLDRLDLLAGVPAVKFIK